MQVRKEQLELDMEQQIGSKSWKEYVKAVCYHPAYLTHMQSASWDSDMQMTPPLWQKVKRN